MPRDPSLVEEVPNVAATQSTTRGVPAIGDAGPTLRRWALGSCSTDGSAVTTSKGLSSPRDRPGRLLRRGLFLGQDASLLARDFTSCRLYTWFQRLRLRELHVRRVLGCSNVG